MVIECPKCGTKKKFNITPELRGKSVIYTCKTAACHEKIKVKIPSLQSGTKERKTVILNSARKYTTATLMLLDSNENEVARYKIKTGANIIGRRSSKSLADVAIAVDDRYMSRRHCVIHASSLGKGTHFILKDYDSKNATLINGQILDASEEIYLQDADIIQLGKTKLKILIQ